MKYNFFKLYLLHIIFSEITIHPAMENPLQINTKEQSTNKQNTKEQIDNTKKNKNYVI